MNTLRRKNQPVVFLVLMVFFLLGSVFGTAFASSIREDGVLAAEAALSFGSSDENLSGLTKTVNVSRIPVTVFLAGAGSMALAVVPVMVALKGFSISFFLGCSYRLCGALGIAKAAAALLPIEMFSLPCILLLGYMALTKPYSSHGKSGYDYITKGIKYLLCIIPAVLAEIYISPFLLSLFP